MTKNEQSSILCDELVTFQGWMFRLQDLKSDEMDLPAACKIIAELLDIEREAIRLNIKRAQRYLNDLTADQPTADLTIEVRLQ